MKYFLWLRYSVLTSLDQQLNVWLWLIPMPGGRFGSGDPDETLSHYWARASRSGSRWARGLCLALHMLDRRHCRDALAADDEGHNTPERMAARRRRNAPVIVARE